MKSLQALVFYRSHSPGWSKGSNMVLAYLDHFGVFYQLIDLAKNQIPAGLETCPLIILAHPDLTLKSQEIAHLREAVINGAGLVSFDPAFTHSLLSTTLSKAPPIVTDQLTITDAGHFITRNHTGGQSYPLKNPIVLPSVPGHPLIGDQKQALLTVFEIDHGRVVTWSNIDWMNAEVLGPLSGLDDLVWRGLVWAARKPFCLRALPPMVTMRVDDVAGRGDLWEQSPLYWVDDSIRAGFKPWLGLFIYNLTPTAVNQLNELLHTHNVTAFPHAFGRPNRNEGRTDNRPFYYYENALPYRSDTYDEFIYFDHQHGAPWSDHEALRGMNAVDEWYASQPGLSRSKVALAHWYEMGANTMALLSDRWNIDLIGKIMDADLPLAPGTPWLQAGPFRQVSIGDAFPFNPGSTGSRPVYYAGFVEMAGRRFFNSITEIRDDAGYEWSPDNDVTASINRASRQLRRAFDSMALASLFTHETDYIYKISPQNWSAIMSGINRGIAHYNALQVTLDDGMRCLRATRTSQLQSIWFDPQSNLLTAHLTGHSESPTWLAIWEEGADQCRWEIIAAFSDQITIQIRLAR